MTSLYIIIIVIIVLITIAAMILYYGTRCVHVLQIKCVFGFN